MAKKPEQKVIIGTYRSTTCKSVFNIFKRGEEMTLEYISPKKDSIPISEKQMKQQLSLGLWVKEKTELGLFV